MEDIIASEATRAQVHFALKRIDGTPLLIQHACMKVGAHVRGIRKRKGWTLERLSFETKIDKGYLSKIENERVNYTRDVLVEIAHALDVPYWRLFGYSYPPEQPTTAHHQAIALIASMNEAQAELALRLLDAIVQPHTSNDATAIHPTARNTEKRAGTNAGSKGVSVSPEQ